jgi:hypothetical protein
MEAGTAIVELPSRDRMLRLAVCPGSSIDAAGERPISLSAIGGVRTVSAKESARNRSDQ